MAIRPKSLTGRIVREMALTLMLACWLPQLTACQRCPQHFIRSELTGVWCAESYETRWIYPDHENRDAGQRLDEPELIIRPDGSFDWTHTMMTMMGKVDQLRNPGDRINYDPSDPVGYVEVKDAEYTEKSSRIVLHGHFRARGIDGSMEFSAKLQPDGKVLYEARTSEVPEEQTILKATMVRYQGQLYNRCPRCIHQPPPDVTGCCPDCGIQILDAETMRRREAAIEEGGEEIESTNVSPLSPSFLTTILRSGTSTIKAFPTGFSGRNSSDFSRVNTCGSTVTL